MEAQGYGQGKIMDLVKIKLAQVIGMSAKCNSFFNSSFPQTKSLLWRQK